MKLIDTDSRVQIKVTAPVYKLCPFVDEADAGTVTATWAANRGTLELHEFRAYLDTFKGRKMTHEDFTREVADHLWALLPDDMFGVSSTWTTAGMAVTVVAI